MDECAKLLSNYDGLQPTSFLLLVVMPLLLVMSLLLVAMPLLLLALASNRMCKPFSP